MKKLILTIALVGSIFSLSAQNTHHDSDGHNHSEKMEHSKKERLERMTKRLELSESQVKQAQAIGDKYKGQSVELRKEMKALNQAKRSEIEAILTPEQFEKLKAVKDKHEGKFKKNKKGKKGRKPNFKDGDGFKPNEKRMAKMKKHLGLDETQLTRIKAVNEKFKPQHSQLKAKLKTLHSTKKAEFETILNADQLEKLKAMKEKRASKRGDKKRNRK